MTAIVGFFGTAMLAVLLAKLAGAVAGCAPDAETGAPCGWLTYAVRGGLLGMIGLPSFIIWRMRASRAGHRNSE